MSSAPSQFQKFEMRVIDRRDIKLADYNPRVISDHARRQLKTVIQEVGLIQPLIWNQRNGVLVSGHQRLSAMDSLEKYRPDGKKSYTLQVAVVDLDGRQERRMNVFLNNQSAMGEFDLDALDAMRQEFDFDGTDLGFTVEDLEVLFPVDVPLDLTDTAEASHAKETLGAIKEERRAAKESLAEEQDIGYYFTVVCKNRDYKVRLLEALGVGGAEDFVRAELVADKYRISLEPNSKSS